MTLTPEEAEAFYKICHALDAYFAKRLTMKLGSAEDAVKVRHAAYTQPKLLEDFANENPAKLSAEDLTTVRSWQHQVNGRFLFQAERKEGCLFHATEGDKVYLVQGLMDRLSDLVPFLPVYVETRLLPFRGKIVIDGLMMPYHMHFSSRMAKGFQEDIKALIAKRGLITSLPEGNTATAEPDDAAMLKFYLSTASTRRQYIREAIALSVKTPALTCQYSHRQSKLAQKDILIQLNATGVKQGHFAILNATIIAGHKDKDKALAAVKSMVPPELMDGIVWVELAK